VGRATGDHYGAIEAGMGWIESVCFSPDGKRVHRRRWGTPGPRHGEVWDADTGREVLVLKGYTGTVKSVCISPDGKRIVSGIRDDMVKVWDAQTGKETLTLRGHPHETHSVCISPDGSRIVSGSRRGP